MVEDRVTNYLTCNPKGEHKYSLIWLHGLGDSAQGFISIFAEREHSFVPSTCKVILPTAPIRAVTLNQGMKMNSWYDITTLAGGAMDLE